MPVRDVEKPVYMPVEQTFAIQGRGTVATGRIERGVLKAGDTVDILGYNKQLKSTVTAVEMFHQTMDKGVAGDQVGALLRGKLLRKFPCLFIIELSVSIPSS